MTMLNACGLNASGFTAPAWLVGDGARWALGRSPLRYHTSLWGLHLLPEDRLVRAPVLVPTSRSRARRRVSQTIVPVLRHVWHGEPVVRIAAHPIDLEFSSVRSLLGRLICTERQNRTPLTYGELAEERAGMEDARPLS
jgi:hypothetical protein